MSQKLKLSLPVNFEKVNSYEDDRFTKVRVAVMHNGLNENRTTFFDEAISEAESSLKNIPLLAFVKKVDGVDDADFGGHEFEFNITDDNGIKITYLGRPIGVIPESNNYVYEENAEGLKYVNVDGFIWNRYANEALDIVKRDKEKSVSMEIEIDEYEEGEDYIANIKKYRYNGIALLGKDVPPAMRNAKLELVNFSADTLLDFMSNFSKQLSEASKNKNGEDIVEENIIIEPTPADVAPIDVTPAEAAPAAPAESTPEAPEAPAAQAEFTEEEAAPLEVAPEAPKENSFSITQDDYNALVSELKQLRAFKAEIDKKELENQKEKLKQEFSDIPADQLEEVISAGTNHDEMELKLFRLRKALKVEQPINQRLQTFAIFDSNIYSSDKPAWISVVESFKQSNGGEN